MYKYDKENDRIIKQGDYTEARIFSHDELQALREALGLKQHSEQKSTVQVAKSDETSFLNINENDKTDAYFADEEQCGGYQTHFTQAEIDQLKQRDDLAIDWGKAIIKPVEDD